MTPTNDNPSIREIEELLLMAADLVDKIGPDVTPILKRLESEYAAAIDNQSQTDRIRDMIAKAKAARREEDHHEW